MSDAKSKYEITGNLLSFNTTALSVCERMNVVLDEISWFKHEMSKTDSYDFLWSFDEQTRDWNFTLKLGGEKVTDIECTN